MPQVEDELLLQQCQAVKAEKQRGYETQSLFDPIPDLRVRFLPVGYVGDAPSSAAGMRFMNLSSPAFVCKFLYFEFNFFM